MLKLDAFSLKDINRFQVIINELVSNGITDIRAGQEYLQRYLDKKHLENKNDQRRAINRKDRVLTRVGKTMAQKEHLEAMESLPMCPDCKDIKMFPALGVEEKVFVCPKCRFSKFMGE